MHAEIRVACDIPWINGINTIAHTPIVYGLGAQLSATLDHSWTLTSLVWLEFIARIIDNDVYDVKKICSDRHKDTIC